MRHNVPCIECNPLFNAFVDFYRWEHFGDGGCDRGAEKETD